MQAAEQPLTTLIATHLVLVFPASRVATAAHVPRFGPEPSIVRQPVARHHCFT